MNLVKKRLYFLLDGNKKVYRKNYYKGFIFHEKLENVGEEIPLKKIHKLISQYLDKGDVPDFINTPLKKLFWEKASKSMRTAVIFSYHKRVVEKSKKVINVESDDWLSLDFFRQYYKGLMEQLSFKKIFRIFKAFRSFVAIKGRHRITLRFENIHLAEDFVLGKKVPSIHWDLHPPARLFPLAWIRHILLEDIFS